MQGSIADYKNDCGLEKPIVRHIGIFYRFSCQPTTISQLWYVHLWCSKSKGSKVTLNSVGMSLYFYLP